ncbi:MAG: hypothetical protein WBA93_29325 [Microcoleaceae cyanobacterium]
MKSHNEDKEMLSINGKEYDVSNIQYKRILIAQNIWESERIKKVENADKKIKSFSNMILLVTLYLIRQPFKHLLKRYSFKDAVKEYFKRLFLTKRSLLSSTKEEFEIIEDWVYYKITGKKKASLMRQKGLLDLMEETLVEMEKTTNLNTEACLKLLQTFVQDQTKTLIQSTDSPKAL